MQIFRKLAAMLRPTATDAPTIELAQPPEVKTATTPAPVPSASSKPLPPEETEVVLEAAPPARPR